MGQDEGENFDDETLLGHGVDAPGEEVMEHAPHRLHHPPPHDGQVLHPREIPPAVPPADDHGNNLLGLPEEVLVQMALVPPVQVELRPLGKVQGKEEKRSEVVEAPRGQVHLVDELPVVHQEVKLEAVEVDPLAGDEAPVGLVREEAGAGGADVLAGGEGEGVQGIRLGLVEVLPDLGQEVEEGEKEGVEGVEPAVEAAWGGDVGEEARLPLKIV